MLAIKTALLTFLFAILALASDFEPVYVEVRQIDGISATETQAIESATSLLPTTDLSESTNPSGTSSMASSTSSMASSTATSSMSDNAATVSGGNTAGAGGAAETAPNQSGSFAAPTGRPGGWALAGAAVGFLGLVV